MTRTLIASLLLILHQFAGFAQDPVDTDYKKWYRQANHLFSLSEPSAGTDSQAIRLFLQSAQVALSKQDGKIAVNSFLNAATIRQTYQHYDEANELYRTAIKINQALLNDSALYYQAYLYMGSSFFAQGNTDSATYYFESASSLSSQYQGQSVFPEQERLYNSLGAIYFESANYLQGKNYFNKALQFTENSTSAADETIVTLKSNIANCLLRLKQYDAAIREFKKLLPLKLFTRVLHHNIAHTFFESNQYDSALTYFNKVPRKDDVVTVRMLNDLGRIYTVKGKWQEANAALDSSITVINRIAKQTKNKDRAVNYLYRSLLADSKGQLQAALRLCNQAMEEVHFKFVSRSVYDLSADEIQTLSPVTFLELLKQKAFLLEKLYRQSKKLKDLNACFQTYFVAIRTASYIKRCFDNDEAKIYFQQDNSQIYHEAIRIAYERIGISNDRDHIDKLIQLTEAYKGNVLYENIQHIQLMSRIKLPQSVTGKEKLLKQSLSLYTSRLSNASSPGQVKQLREQLLSTEVELSRLLKLYEKDPDYQFFKNQQLPGGFTRDSLSSKLDAQTAILSYTVTPRYIYVLAITKHNIKTQVIPYSDALKSALQYFISEVYQNTQGKRYTGYRPSHIIYQHLVEPLQQVIGEQPKWVILPDGVLNYIPFEALCMRSESKDYLLLHRTISYHYSLSLLLLSPHGKDFAAKENQGLFFAPFVHDDDRIRNTGLRDLPYSQTEAAVARMLPFFAEDATKQQWLQSTHDRSRLHLATHAIATDNPESEAFIYFYPYDSSKINYQLYLHEIYQLDLRKTDLVVLSACETAAGPDNSGEGLLSLSRAFLYAGSKGIVSTLWKSEDKVSAFLMRHLYAELEKGYPVEEALQRAKCQLLLDDSIGVPYKTPNYWSNFIYIGQLASTQYEPAGVLKPVIITLGIAGALLLVTILIKWKRRKNLSSPT